MKAQIQNLLVNISRLLAENHEKAWAEKFKQFTLQLDVDYEVTLREIKRTFGGAGSFNDLVLQRNGHALTDENILLNTLQERLYDALQQEITGCRNA